MYTKLYLHKSNWSSFDVPIVNQRPFISFFLCEICHKQEIKKWMKKKRFKLTVTLLLHFYHFCTLLPMDTFSQISFFSIYSLQYVKYGNTVVHMTFGIYFCMHMKYIIIILCRYFSIDNSPSWPFRLDTWEAELVTRSINVWHTEIFLISLR